jgi:hypothetical protein
MIKAVSSGVWRAACAREGIDMASMFDRLFGREKKSAHQAKERLKLVLIHDRTDERWQRSTTQDDRSP